MSDLLPQLPALRELREEFFPFYKATRDSRETAERQPRDSRETAERQPRDSRAARGALLTCVQGDCRAKVLLLPRPAPARPHVATTPNALLCEITRDCPRLGEAASRCKRCCPRRSCTNCSSCAEARLAEMGRDGSAEGEGGRGWPRVAEGGRGCFSRVWWLCRRLGPGGAAPELVLARVRAAALQGCIGQRTCRGDADAVCFVGTQRCSTRTTSSSTRTRTACSLSASSCASAAARRQEEG